VHIGDYKNTGPDIAGPDIKWRALE